MKYIKLFEYFNDNTLYKQITLVDGEIIYFKMNFLKDDDYIISKLIEDGEIINSDDIKDIKDITPKQLLSELTSKKTIKIN